MRRGEERATYRCKSKRSPSTARLPGIRSAIVGKKIKAKPANESKTRSVSPKRLHQTRPSTANRKRRNTVNIHESRSHLMSQTLLSVADKLEQAFNNSDTPQPKVKRVYVIRFDDKNAKFKNLQKKKYTRVIYERKNLREGGMKRVASVSSNIRSSSTSEGRRSVSSNDNRSGDPPWSVDSVESSLDQSTEDDIDKDYSKLEELRNNVRWGKLQSEIQKTRLNRDPQRTPKMHHITDIFEAILKEIENIPPRKESPGTSRKKTLGEIIESDESLESTDYIIPPSMINEETVDVLQALIDHKKKQMGHGEKSSKTSNRLGSPNRPFSSKDWYGLKQPLNYQAEVISEPNIRLAASSSAASGPFCRICHERLGTLVRPCRCRGSMAYVHKECLQMWLTEKETDYCELCRYVFRVIHVPEYRLMPSIGFWYKFAATNEQRKRILIDITLAVVLLPVLIFISLFARSWTAEYPTDEVDGEYEENWSVLGWFLLVYAFRFLTFILNLFYIGAVFVRINHHLGAWLSWYVNKNITVVLENGHPGSVDEGHSRRTPSR